MDNFNNIGSDFDDLFDDSSAVTVDNPVDENQDKAFELPDDMDNYGVVDEPSDDDSEPSNDPEPQETEEPELDV